MTEDEEKTQQINEIKIPDDSHLTVDLKVDDDPNHELHEAFRVELFRSLVVMVAIISSATVAIIKPESASFFSTVAVSATSGYYALSQPRKSFK